MQRRIESADHYREAVHGGEETGEILTLHGKQLQQRLAPGLFITRENHGLHVRDALFGEEHVLSAAESDALGAEGARNLGIARDIGIGAHAKIAAELIRHFHELTEWAGVRIGLLSGGLTEI